MSTQTVKFNRLIYAPFWDTIIRVGKQSTTEPVTPFGYWVTSVIVEYGLNRKTFASRAGVGTSTVSNWIAGLRSPKRDTIKKIALGVSHDEVMRRALMLAGFRAAGFTEDIGGEQKDSPAAQLVQEKLGETTITDLSAEEMDALISRIEDQAEFEVQRVAKEKAAAKK